jgi:deoxycytidylate deaminase|tara:strand:- start:319 stop:603 length:285 start_codon:yes stop_codon:yes gene_type:complete
MSCVSLTDQKYLEVAKYEAEKSPCAQRHGCIAVMGGNIIGRGYNHYRCQSSDGFVKNQCTCHAEMAALREVYKKFNMRGNYEISIKVAKRAKVV